MVEERPTRSLGSFTDKHTPDVFAKSRDVIFSVDFRFFEIKIMTSVICINLLRKYFLGLGGDIFGINRKVF